MSTRLGRLFGLTLAVALLSGSGVAAAPARAADMSISEAEARMVSLINRDRERHGLVRLRIDARLMSIARDRSRDMATKGYFSHTQPDGRDVFDILGASSIRWYSAGEIIAWNNWPTLEDSATVANNGWMGSDGHRAIITSRSFNYFGVGLAVASDGKKYWTGVFLRGPDRTGGWVRPASPSVSDGTTDGTKRVAFSWTGGDVRLQVLTSGFRAYQLQRRIDGGSWQTIRNLSTLRTYALTLAKGRTVEIRIRARDQAGNWGSWRAVSARS
jgi:uncharacterized protein YkwD